MSSGASWTSQDVAALCGRWKSASLLSVIWNRVWRAVAVDLDMVTTFCRFEPRLRGFPSGLDAENPAAGCQGFTGRNVAACASLSAHFPDPSNGVLCYVWFWNVCGFPLWLLHDNANEPKRITSRDQFSEIFPERLRCFLP